MNIEPLNLHGYVIADAIARFVDQYNRALAGGRVDGLEVIHGKGRPTGSSISSSGLREVLRDFLKDEGTRIKGFDAQLAMRGADYLLDVPGKLVYMYGEDATGNAGCTIVIPRQRLSIPHEWLRYKY
ncbi:MAG: hypothetical protein ABI670_02830 [Chloroflexota bacterium]